MRNVKSFVYCYRKGLHLSPERIEFIKELSLAPDIYDRLAQAIAPSIYEHDDVKKGILLQLFGGSQKDFSTDETGRGRFRSELNILLCGDPGTSKSQLLKYVYDLVPRSQYTSGKGSSAVGLTAYVTKDPETRQLVLQTYENVPILYLWPYLNTDSCFFLQGSFGFSRQWSLLH